jgi:hypothetical protein
MASTLSIRQCRGDTLVEHPADRQMNKARHPGHLQPVDDVTGWLLDASAKAEIDGILRETITDPVGPEFMAPPAQNIPA